MAIQRIQLRPGFDVSRIRNQSVATLINCFSEIQDGRGQFPIVGLPGYVEFARIAPPVRGLFVAPDGTLYAVGGNSFYSIAADGVATVLNAIPGTDLVEFAANRGQIAVCTEGRLFVWTPGANQFGEATNALATAPGFVGASSIAVVNSLAIAAIPNSDQFQVSGFNDFYSWAGLSYATAESVPDIIKAIRIVQGEPWFLGGQSIEAWPNTGAANFPFERRGLSQDVGLVSRDTAVNVGPGLVFLGQDRQAGGLSIYQAVGSYQPQPLSNHAVDRLLDRCVHPERAYAYSWRIEGHHFYVFTCDAGTLAYDVASQQWHQQGAGVWPLEGAPPPGRIKASAYFGGKQILGDEIGRLVEVSFASNTEGDGQMVREIVTGPMGGVGRQVIIWEIGLDIAGGLGGLTFDPSVILSLSRDGGNTYDQPRTAKTGLMGQYRRTVRFRRLGRSREFVARFRMTDDAPFQVTGAWADVEEIGMP